jgi:hypothetical protein
MGDQFTKISHEMMAYTSAVNHGKSARKVEKRRNELIAQVKESETTVRKMKPFNGNSTLRDSIAAYFRMTGIVLNHDYGKIVDLEEIAEQSYDKMEAYLLAKEKAEEKLDAAHDNASAQYNAFAEANNIRIVENDTDLARKIAKTNKLTQYSNRVYLLFFKSYKNESYLMEAMSRNDITSVEQSRNALAASSEEDLEKARPLEAFDGDTSVKTALLQLLAFYKTESNDKIPVYTQFLLAKDNFEKIKKAYESTPQSKRTREQVDSYNKSVNEFNRSVNAANAMNDDLNKKRTASLKAWNEAYSAFLDRHTPKHR